MKRRVNVEGVPRLPAFSHAVQVGDQIYVAGTLGTDAEMKLVDGGVHGQTLQALDYIKRILEQCGASLGDVVKVNVYLTDMSTFGEMNDAYLSVFDDTAVPARITVGVNALALDASVEIDCVAVLTPR
ncbi:MAG TPA: RidA family protein [Thermoleophilaceae bacterium]|jgi:reactive intermediate/imine deaminase